MVRTSGMHKLPKGFAPVNMKLCGDLPPLNREVDCNLVKHSINLQHIVQVTKSLLHMAFASCTCM